MIATAELIAGARRGDDGAVDALLKIVQPDIRRYARASCVAADVDDAVQDALCLVHRNIGKLRVVAAFSSWVFAIVRRECVRLAKRALPLARAVEIVEDDLPINSRPDHELRLDIVRAITSLPAHYREVIILRDIEELTIAEIAVAIDATAQATKARLHRARALVREYLES